MQLHELDRRVRSLTRDLIKTIFREQDVYDFINEGIDRVKHQIPELADMKYLVAKQEEVKLLPKQYHHLLAVYATARCFSQDERHYQATTHMNEFETKLDELRTAIESGEVVIKDEEGEKIETGLGIEYVDLDAYWGSKTSDFDEGVEGVE